MKNWLLIITCFLFIKFDTVAQKNTGLYEVLSLKMPEDAGLRAASVAWHPVLKRYYAPKSGNADYLMAIFNAKGKLLSSTESKAMFDVRGLWYNPSLKTFCANGYSDKGWISYILDKKGIPVKIRQLSDSMIQPDAQSVGSFDAKNNLLYFLDGQNVLAYNASTKKEVNKIRLHINYKSEMEEEVGTEEEDSNETPLNINNSVVIYTGIPKNEFALLDFRKKQIQLYNSKTGFITKILSLPVDAPANEMLCFSYCNNIFWLFDIKTKIWKGYK